MLGSIATEFFSFARAMRFNVAQVFRASCVPRVCRGDLPEAARSNKQKHSAHAATEFFLLPCSQSFARSEAESK